MTNIAMNVTPETKTLEIIAQVARVFVDVKKAHTWGVDSNIPFKYLTSLHEAVIDLENSLYGLTRGLTK